MAVLSLFVWLLVLAVLVVICLRVYLRRTVYCPVADRLDDMTVLITGRSVSSCVRTASDRTAPCGMLRRLRRDVPQFKAPFTAERNETQDNVRRRNPDPV